MKAFNCWCIGMWLSIIVRKINISAVCTVHSYSETSRKVQLGEWQEQVKALEEFKYLDNAISQVCSFDVVINGRVSKA